MSPEEYGDTAMEDNEEEGGGNDEEQRASDEPSDGLGRVISDAKLKMAGHAKGSQKVVVPKLRRWQHKARYHT
jgi:hypothetical protein